MKLTVRKPTLGEQLYADWCDAPGSDRERYWFGMNRADKKAWERLGERTVSLDVIRAALDDVPNHHDISDGAVDYLCKAIEVGRCNNRRNDAK